MKTEQTFMAPELILASLSRQIYGHLYTTQMVRFFLPVTLSGAYELVGALRYA